MIKGNTEEYFNLLKEDIQNIVCTGPIQIDNLSPHLVHYKYEKFLYAICNDHNLTLYNKATDDERKKYDKSRRRIAIKHRIVGHEDKEPFETCIFYLNRDLAYHDLEQLECSSLLRVKLESYYTSISELTDVFYKSYHYAFCPINAEYIIAQLKQNILEKDLSTEEKQKDINFLDDKIDNSYEDFLRDYKFIVYKISIIRE